MSEIHEGTNPVFYKGPSSPKLDGLRQFKQDLFSANNEGICAKAPANFLATLQIATLQPEIEEIYHRMQLEVPHYLIHPYRIATVPLAYYDPELMDAVDLGQTANVLIKANIYANHLGLCLDKDFAGLFVMPFDAEISGRAIIRRLWNEDVFRVPEKAIIRSGHGVNPSNRGHWDAAKSHLMNLLERKYRERFSINTPLKDALFDLCRQLDIPIDAENFHYI